MSPASAVNSRVQRRSGVSCCRDGVALAEARRVPGNLRPGCRTAGVGFVDHGGARAEVRWASERGGSGAASVGRGGGVAARRPSAQEPTVQESDAQNFWRR
ncbi:hypothetical protein EUGRSUZ_A00633 [Eucalyptus grandis]|uniref:Uncharacterized protein n=2 Tax=Eucalyptus grandis TaxID=71139 RepID=A0ACC3M1U2_EUCGR|nr:hypothetical protein EUGRSUZ_A00633 [Eucalyptus grandis]